MEEDDDDLYEPGDSLPQNQTGQKENGDQPSDAAAKPAEGEEYEVEEEEEDDVCTPKFAAREQLLIRVSLG